MLLLNEHQKNTAGHMINYEQLIAVNLLGKRRAPPAHEHFTPIRAEFKECWPELIFRDSENMQLNIWA